MQKKDLATWQKAMLVVVGLFVFCIGISKFVATPSRTNWKITTGKVIFLSISEHSVSTIWSWTASFATEVIFEYVVGSKSYVSDHVPLSLQGFRDRNTAERFLRNFEIGEPISVYYNPRKPQTAVYVFEDNNSTLANLGIVMFGGIMLAYGTFLFFITRT